MFYAKKQNLSLYQKKPKKFTPNQIGLISNSKNILEKIKSNLQPIPIENRQ